MGGARSAGAGPGRAARRRGQSGPLSAPPVTIGIPVLDGERTLGETLAAVRRQRLDRELELLVVDSGSRDRSREIARAQRAEVAEIPRGSFSHGGTRNLIMERAAGSHVAFLTQDAVPADDRWLARLLAGFELGSDVGLVYGPYRARPEASHMVRRELDDWFRSFSPDGRPRIDRLGGAPLPSDPGPLSFFTDANGCVARAAWEQVPFRDAPYAEDHLLARDMLAAGWTKVFLPDAAVVHSHEYGSFDQFRRCFDEWRALREVYGMVEPLHPRPFLGRVRQEVRADRALLRAEGAGGRALTAGTLASVRYWLVRSAGAAAGSRADRLPAGLRARLSLEGRAGFEPALPPAS